MGSNPIGATKRYVVLLEGTAMAKQNRQPQRPNEITWRAAEYEHYEKTPGWFLSAGVAAALLLGIALWQKNFFFAVFIVIAFGAILYFSQRRPEIMDFSIGPEGVMLGHLFLEYDRFEDFAIRERRQQLHEVVLKRKTTLNPQLRMPIDSKLAERARAMLAERLPEVPYQESLLETLTDLIGF